MKRQKDSWTEISWEEALDRTAFSLKKIIKKYGANAVATYRGNPNVHNLDAMLYGTQFIKSIGSKNRFSASTVDQIPHQLGCSFYVWSPTDGSYPRYFKNTIFFNPRRKPYGLQWKFNDFPRYF